MGIIFIMFHKLGCSGFPSPTDDFLESPLDLNSYLVDHPAATFFIRVLGNANAKLGFRDRDVLVIDRSLIPEKEDVFLASVNGELKLRKFNSKRNKEVDELWGVVIHIIRSLKRVSLEL